MSMKIRTKMLIFLLLMMCSHWLTNLIMMQTLHTFFLFSTMKINFLKIMILWRLQSFVKSRWTNYWCHNLYVLIFSLKNAASMKLENSIYALDSLIWTCEFAAKMTFKLHNICRTDSKTNLFNFLMMCLTI